MGDRDTNGNGCISMLKQQQDQGQYLCYSLFDKCELLPIERLRYSDQYADTCHHSKIHTAIHAIPYDIGFSIWSVRFFNANKLLKHSLHIFHFNPFCSACLRHDSPTIQIFFGDCCLHCPHIFIFLHQTMENDS